MFIVGMATWAIVLLFLSLATMLPLSVPAMAISLLISNSKTGLYRFTCTSSPVRKSGTSLISILPRSPKSISGSNLPLALLMVILPIVIFADKYMFVGTVPAVAFTSSNTMLVSISPFMSTVPSALPTPGLNVSLLVLVPLVLKSRTSIIPLM